MDSELPTIKSYEIKIKKLAFDMLKENNLVVDKNIFEGYENFSALI